MKGTILVTDTLFILDEHVRRLNDAGYEVERVEKPDMSENEIIDAIKGKVGYILGGIEYVTEAVFDSTDTLKAIVFTGTGFKGHIPGWKRALAKGIKVGNTPFANVYEVAEWGLAATLAMQRNLFELGPQGSKKFHTITSIPDLSIGIVGLGHIGKKYADMMSALEAKEVSYWSRSEKDTDYEYKSLDQLFQTSDIIFVAVGDDSGEDFIDESLLKKAKEGALLVSISHQGIINESALSRQLKSGKMRAALDCINDKSLFEGLSSQIWYGSNASAAYNSIGYLRRSSNMAVKTIINLIEGRKDKYEITNE